ncbi:PQQ-binding-like beta-propeller repeat protein [Streptomyces canus]
MRWAPLVANGTLYVGTNDGRMVAPDAVSGEEQWTAETGSPVFSTPAVTDGVLHFGLQNGRLPAVGPDLVAGWLHSGHPRTPALSNALPRTATEVTDPPVC